MKLHLALLTAVCLAAPLHAEDWKPEEGFISLFNGKDLTGWCFREKTKKENPNPGAILAKHDGKTEAADAGRYIVKDGVIAGTFPPEADKLTGQLLALTHNRRFPPI